MTIWHQLADLAVDEYGDVWLILDADGAPLRRRLWELRGFRFERKWIRLGDVEGADVPSRLSRQLAELLELWRDQYDEWGEWRETFVRQSGVFS